MYLFTLALFLFLKISPLLSLSIFSLLTRLKLTNTELHFQLLFLQTVGTFLNQKNTNLSMCLSLSDITSIVTGEVQLLCVSSIFCSSAKKGSKYLSLIFF